MEPNIALKISAALETGNELIDKALAYIKETGLERLPETKVELSGEDLICCGATEAKLRSRENAPLEAHKKYIDLQVIISGKDKFGLKAVKDCGAIKKEYNEAKDTLFYEGGFNEEVTLEGGEMILIKPDTAHAPCIGEGTVRKCVFKIKA